MASYFFCRDALESDDSNLEEPKNEQEPAAESSFDSEVNHSTEEDNFCCYCPLLGTLLKLK